MNCAICLQEIGKGKGLAHIRDRSEMIPDSTARKTGEVFHSFHIKCLNDWLERDPTCPLCRRELTVQPTFVMKACQWFVRGFGYEEPTA